MIFFVYTYRPPYPENGLRVEALKEKDYCIDLLPATVTSVWRVDAVTKKQEAIAAVVEFAAGKKVCVQQIIPKPDKV